MATKTKKAAKLEKVLPILSYLAWVAISFFAAFFVFELIKTVTSIFSKSLLSNNIYKSIIYIIFDAVLLVFIFVPYKILKKPLPKKEELGIKGLPTWTDILLAIVGFVAYLLLAALLTKIFEIFPFFDASQKQVAPYEYLTPGFERILAYFTVAVIPPIAEEIAFRGWLYQKLRTKISGRKSRIISILLVSILFGLMHGQWNVGINVFSMSVVFCLIRELTGTIYGGILTHAIINSIAFFYFIFSLTV